jgi:hypothetical protein
MKKLILIGLPLGMVLTLGSTTFAAGPAIYQRESANGAVELSNLGGEDEESKLLLEAPQPDVKPVSPVRAGADSAVNLASGSDAQKPPPPEVSKPASAPVDTSTPESTGVLSSRLEQYRQTMLNPPLLPNGRPANPAIQRRYLMVKKSDYVAGN